MDSATPPLRLVAWELTRKCVLACRHCRASASGEARGNELTTEECRKIIDSIASLGRVILILTGGEPLLRDDLYELSRYGGTKGLRVVLATCGTLLDGKTCAALRESGIARISVSIDGSNAVSHDAFRGVAGAFDGVMRGIDAAREAGLEFQVNTTITRSNLPELPAIYDRAVRLGAVSFHPFLLVPTGRAAAMIGEMINAEDYERTLHLLYELRFKPGITVKPTCAPHYYRIVRQREQAAGRAVRPETHGLDAMTKGCLGGHGFAFISHIGKVQICGFLEKEAGDLRDCDFDLSGIWRDSPLLREIRAIDAYHGKCGYCDFRGVCGGCRARAFAVHGDYLGEESHCLFQPNNQDGKRLGHERGCRDSLNAMMELQ